MKKGDHESAVYQSAGAAASPALVGPDPAFQIERDDALCVAVVRIYQAQVDESIKHLRGADFHTGIHEARKRFKKIRTLLRAMRHELGSATFKAENVFFRDIAQSIGAVRDAQALLECLGKLRELTDDTVRAEVVLKLERRRNLLEQVEGRGDAEKVACKLEQHRSSSATWHLHTTGFAPLCKGIETIYGHGWRDCRQLVQKGGGTAVEFHEFRKVTKQMWSVLVMVVNMWLAVLVPLAKEWKSLADDLGDHHDLHCLMELAESRELFMFGAENGLRATLVQAIEAKRVALEKDILTRASLLYALEPAAFATQLDAMWTFWHRKPVAVANEDRRVKDTK